MHKALKGRNPQKKVLAGMKEWSEALLISALGSFAEQMPTLVGGTVSSLSNQDGDSRRVPSEIECQGWRKG